MSTFGAKRKPRVIQTLDDEDADLGPSLIGGEESKKEVPIPPGPIKFGRNRPAKSSSLRKSININDLENVDQSATVSGASTGEDHRDQDAGTPVVIRPAISRTSSLKQKKRASTSRLSFGPSEIGGDGDIAGNEAITTPKKTLGKRVVENNALRRSGSAATLPPRFSAFGGEEEAPRYSKEYLEELQSSTPNTPQNLSSLRITDDAEDGDSTALNKDDIMDLDPSELDGALIVQSQDLSRRSPSAQALSNVTNPAHILSEAEIRERKERRARLAQEAEFIPLDDSDSDNSDPDHQQPSSTNRVTLRFNDTKANKKSESRLIAEDEDLGEGYDEFVSDGGLALGRKAEREAARRHRQEMAELIQAAEDGSDAESDDSEAERRAAYEAAQRRAGMDGLGIPHDDDGDDLDGTGGGVNMIPRMKALPELGEVLQRMRNLVQGLEDEVNRKRERIAELERERGEILAREVEVQEILNQAGQKYQAVVGSLGGVSGGGGPGTPGAGGPSAIPSGFAGEAIKLSLGQSPLRAPPVLPPGIAVPGGELPVERGLESFGTTPTTRPDSDADGGAVGEDKDGDQEMS